MTVYIISKNNKPLMPCNSRKARILLNQKKAVVIKRTPFTIQLLHGSSGYTQPITLGVDAGSKHIGLSATTKEKELYSSNTELRTDIVDLLATRRESRRTRRNRLRYRKPRFQNRKASKQTGWLAPSITHKINTHLKVVDDIHKLLPITNIIVEVASFDIQKIKNPTIQGTQYQQGVQLDFWNVREYVFFRDNHTCQCCKGKSKDKILNVHHIETRKTGGDSPNNLITLCETCHTNYHKGIIKLPKSIKRGMSFKDAAFMGIMRWSFYNQLKVTYPSVSMTYGYITKNTRIINNLPKEHYVDAYCITGNINAKRSNIYYYQKKIRNHNRKIHKSNILKGGRLKLNQASYKVKGFRLYDKVSYNNQKCYITGRRSSGYFALKTLDNQIIHKSAKAQDLKFIETRKPIVIERRRAV